MSQPPTVKAQLLPELDDFEDALVTGTGISGIEETDGEGPQLLQWCPRSRHPTSVSTTPNVTTGRT